jgi:small subunit ribosomal protein S16
LNPSAVCGLLASAGHSYNRRLSAAGRATASLVRTKQGIFMVVIRLARGGAKKRPFFNIVATDSRNPRDGRFIERVGFYNPVAAGDEPKFRVASDRLTYWTGVGARMSPTVTRLVKQYAAASQTPAEEKAVAA